jgi:hypothetical protein
MTYSFSVEHAKKYGQEEAVLLQNFIFWIRQNKANMTNQRDGRTWTYNSIPAFAKLFPFWTEKQIRRILDSLIRQKVLLRGDYNRLTYDKTSWYSLVDESLLELSEPQEDSAISPNGQMDVPKRADRSAQTVAPIPDIKPDEKPDGEGSAVAPETPTPTVSLPQNEDSNEGETDTLRESLEKAYRGDGQFFATDTEMRSARALAGKVGQDRFIEVYAYRQRKQAGKELRYVVQDFDEWNAKAPSKREITFPAAQPVRDPYEGKYHCPRCGADQATEYRCGWYSCAHCHTEYPGGLTARDYFTQAKASVAEAAV